MELREMKVANSWPSCPYFEFLSRDLDGGKVVSRCGSAVASQTRSPTKFYYSTVLLVWLELLSVCPVPLTTRVE